MIRTDGARTIANTGPIPGQVDLADECALLDAKQKPLTDKDSVVAAIRAIFAPLTSAELALLNDDAALAQSA